MPRKADSQRSLDLDAAEQVARHIADGGITRFLYGGNAFLYHISLAEYEALLDWLADFPAPRWPIPSLGPSFGRAIDQACILRRHAFPTAMVLPCGDPRDPRGIEAGMREIADAAGMPLIIYLKSEDGFGSDREQSLDAIGRLVDDGVAIAIKYAIVRDDPRKDAMLDGPPEARRSPARHQRHGRTAGDRPPARLRARRDDHGIGLHRAVAVQRVPDGLRRPATGRRPRACAPSSCRSRTSATRGDRRACCTTRPSSRASRSAGPIPPFVSPLSAEQLTELAPVARGLRERDE